MSQTLYSILKPLVFAGESGVLHVKHLYGGQGAIALREGLITGVRTDKYRGRNAVLTLNCWVSVDCVFRRGENDQAAGSSSGIDTSEVLKALEKIDGIAQKINKLIPNHQMIFCVSSSQLKDNARLSGKDLKYALSIDGKKSVAALIKESSAREIDVLAAICRLVSMGVARRVQSKAKAVVKKVQKAAPEIKKVKKAAPDIKNNVRPVAEEGTPLAAAKRLNFLAGLEKKLGGHFGPAAGIFIGELMSDLGFQAKTLTEEQAFDIVDQLGEHLEEGEVAQIEFWAATILN